MFLAAKRSHDLEKCPEEPPRELDPRIAWNPHHLSTTPGYVIAIAVLADQCAQGPRCRW
jgi:hypothetical protein